MYSRLTLCIAALMFTFADASAQQGALNDDWPSYGGDNGSTKYSSLDDINAENVAHLEIAWRWKTDNFGPRLDHNFRATPLAIDGVLYVTAGSRRVVAAIDGATGETLWVYRPDEPDNAGSSRSSSGRGVAYWTDGVIDRVFLGTRAFKLLSIDANTGLLDPDFGVDGEVDLREGLRPNVGWGISSTSPPIVSNDVVVVGSSMPISDTTLQSPPGHVRAYDPRTGERLWTFHTIPQGDEFGVETWENDSWKYTGNTGVWTLLSADDDLGYVYLPVETPTNDYYGGHRLGDNLFAESLVCLDIKTGKRVWHYQLVHHGIYDYDNPAPPVLCNIVVDGKPVKAVAQVTKQGFTYVFDRLTGEPVWPIVERPIPQTDIPGERTSRTQPFPTKPPPFEVQGITPNDLIDFTPELKAEALVILEKYRYGPLFTPPSIYEPKGKRGTIHLPGTFGGANWQGAAFDPETGVLYVPSITEPQIIAMVKPDPNRSQFNYVRSGSMRVPGPQGLPLVKPPWSRITAIDMNKGELLWMTPNGYAPEYIRNHPALDGIELPRTGNAGRGGALLTKTLLFVGDGGGIYNTFKDAGGPYFRAYDKATGDVVWEYRLPARQTGVPMTYRADGKQYIVVAIGSREHSAELVALSLR